MRDSEKFGLTADTTRDKLLPMLPRHIFISYSGDDSFEASLLQYAVETLLAPENVIAWTYHRDQSRSEKEIAKSLKEKIRTSAALIFLVSPGTINGGAAQWMELAYADSYDVKTFVLLHHLNFQELKSKTHGVPPLLLASQCNNAHEWQTVVSELRTLFQ